MTAATSNIGVIILAAGASSRLGQPKQLLPYAGKTLLAHSLEVAADSVAGNVIVVLGAHAAEISSATKWNTAEIIINSNWQEGMASSIRCGIQTLIKANPLTECAVLMLCDQPYVTAALLNDLINAWQSTGDAIIASNYDGTIGVPALFHNSIFPELLQLTGDTGARAIIQRHAAGIGIVSFSDGNVDIDTEADYVALQKSTGRH